MRTMAPIALASLLLGCASTPSPRQGTITSVTPAPEWNAVFERTEGWIGGDGAATEYLFNDHVIWLFGDSGVGRVEGGKYAPGSTLVNNAIAIHTRAYGGKRGTPPEPDEIRFAWGKPNADGKPTALFIPPRPGEWYWPTGGGIQLNQAREPLILFMSRLFRPREHDDGIWNFDGRGSDMLVIDTPSADPHEWNARIVPTPGSVGPDLKQPARRITWGTSVHSCLADARDAVYIYGVDTTDPLNKKALLATVRERDADDTTHWRFWTGAPGEGWSDNVRDAAPIAEHVMDEFSVNSSWMGMPWSEPKLHIMIYSQELLGRQILARTARHPWGPWSEPKAIYECPEPLSDNRLIVYSAKSHPELSRDGELLVSYCVNSTDFWHMLSDASIYRPRFIRVPLSLLPEPPPPR